MCSEHSQKFGVHNTSKSKLSLGARLLISLGKFYQLYISGLKGGPTCRFEPTCSSYAMTAVQVHGALKGTVLAIVRLSKCGPWHPGGFDPVPEKPLKLTISFNDFEE